MKMDNRRAISAYIAVLFLIGLAVAGGVLLYTGLLSTLSTFNSNQLPGTLSIDTARVVNSTSCLVYVRNIGDSVVVIDSAYVNGDAASNVTRVTINPNAVEQVRINGSFTSGTKYSFKLVTEDNTQVLFQLKADF
jgi:hypothetical protein